MENQPQFPKGAEERRLAEEVRLREAELSLRERELEAELKRRRYENRRSVSPLVLATVAAASAVFGALSTSIVEFATEKGKLDLEKQRFQYSLMLKAVEL